MNMKETPSSRELFEDAVWAYEHYCVVHGYGISQPSWSLSEVDQNEILLCNVNGPLAKFLVKDEELVLVDLGEEEA